MTFQNQVPSNGSSRSSLDAETTSSLSRLKLTNKCYILRWREEIWKKNEARGNAYKGNGYGER
jgi:hypothetical protein